MDLKDSNLECAVARLIAAAQSAFQPILDRRPWTDIAVNPAPLFREAVVRLEDSPAFVEVVQTFNAWSFEQGLTKQRPAKVDPSEPPPQWWKVASFLRNCRLYDNLIAGVDVSAASVAAELRREGARTDVLHKDIAYLENLRCDGPAVVPEAFTIRHLTDGEIDHLFCGFSNLDRIETRQATRQALESEWFAVVEHPDKPLGMHLVIPGAIGLHDFHCSPLPDINLALNLFKPAAGPVVIRQTYHFETTLFYRARGPRPEYSDDLQPGSWGGSPERPRLYHYRLNTEDAARLPKFWTELHNIFFSHRHYFPKYLHRAIGRFLRACGWSREEREFRQLLYVMALEALYSEDGGRPRYWNRRTNREEQSTIKETLARCCGGLIAPDANALDLLARWLRELYRQRSDVAHSNTFEQELFVEQSQDPDEHQDAQKLAKMLDVDSRCIWDGPDVEFAVLHNIVRESILMFIEHAAAELRDPAAIATMEELDRKEGGSRPPAPIRNRRDQLRQELQDRLAASRRTLVQRVNDAYVIETDRLAIRTSLRQCFQGIGGTC